MGILDELRAKAEEKKSVDQEEDQRRELEAKRFAQEVRPRFKALYNYLRELVEHLNYLNSEIPVSFAFPTIKKKHEFLQKDYLITANASDEITQFSLRCKAVAKKPIFLQLSKEQEADRYINTLMQYSLKASKPIFRLGNAAGNVVEVDPVIPLNFSFTLDAEHSVINVVSYNFPSLGNVKRNFDADQLSDQWMEDIGDMIVRKKDIITPLSVTDEERQRIKEEIRRRAAMQSGA